jgi:hypothetical protein
MLHHRKTPGTASLQLLVLPRYTFCNMQVACLCDGGVQQLHRAHVEEQLLERQWLTRTRLDAQLTAQQLHHLHASSRLSGVVLSLEKLQLCSAASSALSHDLC